MRFGVCSGFGSFVREGRDKARELTWEEGLKILPENCAFLKELGYDYIEFPVAMVSPDQGEEKFLALKETMKGASLRPEAFNCFIPGSIKITGPGADLGRAEAYAAVAIRRMAELGGKVVVFGSGGARKVPDGFPKDKARQQIIEFLKRIAPHAGEHGVIIAIEPLNTSECNIILTVSEGMEYVKALDDPSVKVLADLWHIMFDSEPFDNVVRAGADLFHVHIADTQRLSPGSGSFDFPGFFRALKAAGYDKRISLEYAVNDFRKEVSESLPFLLKTWKEA